MNKVIKRVMMNALKSEASLIFRSNDEIQLKIEKMSDIINLQKILENYDELEPLLKEFFDKKAEQEKWER